MVQYYEKYSGTYFKEFRGKELVALYVTPSTLHLLEWIESKPIERLYKEQPWVWFRFTDDETRKEFLQLANELIDYKY